MPREHQTSGTARSFKTGANVKERVRSAKLLRNCGANSRYDQVRAIEAKEQVAHNAKLRTYSSTCSEDYVG